MVPLVLLSMPCVQHQALESAVLHVAPLKGPRHLQVLNLSGPRPRCDGSDGPPLLGALAQRGFLGSCLTHRFCGYAVGPGSHGSAGPMGFSLGSPPWHGNSLVSPPTWIANAHPRSMCSAMPRSSCSMAELSMGASARHARGNCRVNRHERVCPGLNDPSISEEAGVLQKEACSDHL